MPYQDPERKRQWEHEHREQRWNYGGYGEEEHKSCAAPDTSLPMTRLARLPQPTSAAIVTLSSSARFEAPGS